MRWKGDHLYVGSYKVGGVHYNSVHVKGSDTEWVFWSNVKFARVGQQDTYFSTKEKAKAALEKRVRVWSSSLGLEQRDNWIDLLSRALFQVVRSNGTNEFVVQDFAVKDWDPNKFSFNERVNKDSITLILRRKL